MNKKPRTVGRGIGPLVEQVRTLVQSARGAAAASVNTLQVLTNFEIGRVIVEHEQRGKERAAYGKETLKALAARLTREFGRGFSERNLEYMRKLYLLWNERLPHISQTVSAKSDGAAISQTPSAKCDGATISQTVSAKSDGAAISQTVSAKSEPSKLNAQTSSGRFTLSWSHYIVLIGIEDDAERSFYEIESAQSGWSLSELKRQIASSLYERLALSRDKKRVRQLAERGHTLEQPTDFLKSPLVLEFLGLEEKPAYTESDLETALIDKLQQFLLELGKGFLFEARQKRFTFDEDNYFVDLVFYNRLLRCYVLFDLKLDKLTHQDLGQMQMYVNYYDREVTMPDEKPTVGIILCKRKKDALVELTLPKDANIYAAEYQHYLPSKKVLRRRLLEWVAEEASR